MILVIKLHKILRLIQRYWFFVLEIVGWVAILYFLTPLLVSFLVTIYPNITIQFGDFVLLITAAFILAYTYESKKMRAEIIFQGKMTWAYDISFRMTSRYRVPKPDQARLFGELSVAEAPNSVRGFTFLSAVMMRPIGRCTAFHKPISPEGSRLVASYFIEGEKAREDFLRALKLKDGEITAKVLITNGLMFHYTFKAVTDNWRRTLQRGAENLNDEFVLIKKELIEP